MASPAKTRNPISPRSTDKVTLSCGPVSARGILQRMIVLFTDFGEVGPYVGQVKAVLMREAPGIPVIDLLHDAPMFQARASSYLLASLIDVFPTDVVFLCVVDPGVGSSRSPAVIEADGRRFVGPDNGLFELEEIIYLDNFGNAMTGLRAKNVPVHAEMIVNDRRLVRSRTFSDKPEGSAFWYENSSGLVEFAVNQGDAKTVLGIDVGSKFAIDMSPDHS